MTGDLESFPSIGPINRALQSGPNARWALAWAVVSSAKSDACLAWKRRARLCAKPQSLVPVINRHLLDPSHRKGRNETKQSAASDLQASDIGCHRDDVCRGRVVWDEENLHELETSKTPKQKITEPKTPYYAPGGAGDGGLSPTPDDRRLQMDSASHAEAVRHALSEVATGVATEDGASSSRSSGSSWNFSEDELDEMERDDEGNHSDGYHSGSFEEHRRKHYDNEYRKAKLLSSQSELAAEDDDAAANGEVESESVALKRPLQQ